jgi:hypothetical protein
MGNVVPVTVDVMGTTNFATTLQFVTGTSTVNDEVIIAAITNVNFENTIGGGMGTQIVNLQGTVTYDFTPSAAVPEPATLAMILLGFFGLGFVFGNQERGDKLPKRKGRHMRSKLLSFLCIAAAITFSGAAQAVVLTPGVTTPLPGTSVASDPSLAGTVVQDILTPFTMMTPSGVDTGEVQSRVVLAVDGTFDFYWRVFNDATSANPIGFLRTGNISTSSYDANFRTDGLGDVAPQSAFLFATPTPGFINFAFPGPQGLQPGQSSLFIFLDTNATNFAQTASVDVATFGTFQSSNEISTFGPAAVPEPATWAMMLIGFLGLGLAFKQSRRKVSMA